jgi:hypothetical protein
MAPRNYVLEGIERRERESRARLVAERDALKADRDRVFQLGLEAAAKRDRYREALEEINSLRYSSDAAAVTRAPDIARQALAKNQED